MEKDTGFIECERNENLWKDAKERLLDFDEFKLPLDDGSRCEQAARCMNCWVTMCHSYIARAFEGEPGQRNTVATVLGSDAYATNVPKVFTVGDMYRGQSLVIWAIAEERMSAREIDQYLMGYTNF